VTTADSANNQHRFQRLPLAWRVFGKDRVDDARQQVAHVLRGWGYQIEEDVDSRISPVLCQALLLNRSPMLHDLTTEAFHRIRQHPDMPKRHLGALYGIQRAAAALGHCSSPPPPNRRRMPAIEGASSSWTEWLERWHTTSTLSPKVRNNHRSVLSKVGRWLATEHPQITEPAQWTRQTCAAWVAAVDNLRVGDYVQQLAAHEKRTGQPVAPHTKAAVGRAQHRTRRPAYQPQQSALPARTAPGLIADPAVQRQRDRSPPRRLRPLAARRLPDPRRLRRGAGPRRGLPARRPHPQDRHLVYQTRRPDPGQGDRDMANLRPQQPRMLDRKTSEHVDLLFATRARRVANT
jgi:hypothetical protein